MKKKVLVVAMLILTLSISVFAFAACGDKDTEDTSVRIVMPDGTPALAVARMFTDNKKIAGLDAQYEIIAAAQLASEMGTGSADVLIMPTNVGVQQIASKGYDYKLAAVCVEGSLFVVGKPENVDGEFTLDDLKGKKVACIGEGGTPDLIFKYIVDNTDGVSIGEGATDIQIQYVAEAPVAKTALTNGTVDFAIVGEPAATAFGAAVGATSRLNLQTLYAEISGFDTFPQASLFVKSTLAANATFMAELKAALTASVAWVAANTTSVNTYMTSIGSTTTFPVPSLSRTAICAKFVANDYELQAMILNYLTIVGVNVGLFA